MERVLERRKETAGDYRQPPASSPYYPFSLDTNWNTGERGYFAPLLERPPAAPRLDLHLWKTLDLEMRGWLLTAAQSCTSFGDPTVMNRIIQYENLRILDEIRDSFVRSLNRRRLQWRSKGEGSIRISCSPLHYRGADEIFSRPKLLIGVFPSECIDEFTMGSAQQSVEEMESGVLGRVSGWVCLADRRPAFYIDETQVNPHYWELSSAARKKLSPWKYAVLTSIEGAAREAGIGVIVAQTDMDIMNKWGLRRSIAEEFYRASYEASYRYQEIALSYGEGAQPELKICWYKEFVK